MAAPATASKWAWRLERQLENMGAFQPYPAYLGPGKRAVPPEVALSGGIMVDAAGKRFVDETRYPGGLGIKMLDLPGKQAYEIFDERIFQLHRDAPGLRSLGRLFDAGLLLKAETAAELADKLAIDAEGLKQTIGECNALSTSGEKDAFGRVLPQPLEAPYYGIRVTVALYHTQGGLKVNADGQVTARRWIRSSPTFTPAAVWPSVSPAKDLKAICRETGYWLLSVSA